MRILDCPTEQMWVDVLTKPLQGMTFKRMRAELMNCSVNYEENEERETTLTARSLSEKGQIPSQTSQECVEDSMKSPRVDVILMARPRVDVISTARPRVDVRENRSNTLVSEKWNADITPSPTNFPCVTYRF